MIEQLSQLSTLRPAAEDASQNEAARDAAEGFEGFSAALAVATLERQAAAALEVHGATPSEGAIATQSSRASAATTRSEASAEPQANAADAQTERAQPRVSSSTRISANADAPSLQSAPASTPAVAAAPDRGAAVIAGGALAANALPAASQSSPRDAATAPRLADGGRNAKAPPPRAPQAPAAPAQDFARLVARRLENATAFDIRLDPPDLGRVEGRVSFGDEGKTVLSLKFDNQAAFDQFSRDEATLRAALSEAGVDLSNAEFLFSFNDDADQGPSDTSKIASAPFASDAAFYEPDLAAYAPHSRGAVDLRV
ncbi:MAG: flagellar hook-length control protein FliK [Pseudomonadota bacterium]